MIQDDVEDNTVLDESCLPTSIELDRTEVPPTDITFECPHCSKNLSIDPRGAGLVILCAQCGKPVTVPIPPGMEIDDFDATPEELSIQLLSARQNLAKAQARLVELEEELDELRSFRDSAMRVAEDRKALRERVRNQLAIAGKMQGDAYGMICEVAALITEPDEE